MAPKHRAQNVQQCWTSSCRTKCQRRRPLSGMPHPMRHWLQRSLHHPHVHQSALQPPRHLISSPSLLPLAVSGPSPEKSRLGQLGVRSGRTPDQPDHLTLCYENIRHPNDLRGQDMSTCRSRYKSSAPMHRWLSTSENPSDQRNEQRMNKPRAGFHATRATWAFASRARWCRRHNPAQNGRSR